MLTPIILAVFYSLCAGIMCGSFALPIKHIKTWQFEHIWLGYAFWGFLIFPWLTIIALDPHVSQIYGEISSKMWLIILTGGFLFGAGQICFALALNFIGLGLGFLINIGLGTVLGFLLPLFTLHVNRILSFPGMVALTSMFLIVLGLLVSYRAGSQRDKEKQQALKISSQPFKKSVYSLGILLAVFAGVFSAGQNYTFALTNHIQLVALTSGIDSSASSIIIWPPFLTCSFIPYASYMLFQHYKNKSFHVYRQPKLFFNHFSVIIMGGFWFGSLALYSKASLLMGVFGAIIAWPLFMVLIILMSNFWGWKHHEWQDCQPTVKRNALLAIVLLVAAVIILAYSAKLS